MAVYAGGELVLGEVNEQEKRDWTQVHLCCKTATFSDALYSI